MNNNLWTYTRPNVIVVSTSLQALWEVDQCMENNLKEPEEWYWYV
jgi:hypothetical protein